LPHLAHCLILASRMTRTLHLPPLESPDLDLNPTFNVVIAYEDFEAGKHAKKTYDFLVENIGHDCQFTNQMWKFEVLFIPKLREMAARDAAMADIVMISSHGSELPAEVKAWVELWVTKPHHPIALVALFDQPNQVEPEKNAVRSYLAHVAERGQVEFFAQPDEWPGGSKTEEGRVFQRRPGLDGRALSTLSNIVQRDTIFPHWGINE
jgi:hypothetical protein